jgi:site-specific DNA-methyltransferase (adenine-specific)
MAVAIEDAGFQIRDQIMWIYGSGFPKSLNLKDEWQGWGTALKPAHEPLVLARKPIEGTVAANVMTHGTGGLNIDGTRVGSEIVESGNAGRGSGHNDGTYKLGFGVSEEKQTSTGRWPANVIHDGSDEVVALFPSSKAPKPYVGKEYDETSMFGIGGVNHDSEYGDSGSAARFFYCAKASKRDRNEGLDDFDAIRVHDGRKAGNPGGSNPRNRTNDAKVNHHPTVKPTDLMRYLCRLITPPNGVVLDPFMGSGSTGRGAILEGFDFIGIEQDAEYVEIAKARIAAVHGN